MPRDCYTIYDVVKGKKYIDLENVVVSGVKKIRLYSPLLANSYAGLTKNQE